MEAIMKENGLKTKNRERSVKNLNSIKTSCISDRIMTIRNLVEENYLIFKNKRYMKVSFQTIKKKVNSKYFKKMGKFLDPTADKTIYKEIKNQLDN